MKGNTTGNVVISVIVVLLVVFGIYYWATHQAPVSTQYTTTTQPSPTPESGNQASAPVVTTKEASYISQSTAVLNGEVNPSGVQSSYWYEYGETSSLGSFSSPQLIGGGYAKYSAPTLVSGLKSNTLYYYRLAAQNQYGKVYGEVSSFKTTNTPPAPYLPPNVQTKNASSIDKTSAVLNGTINPNGAVTFYWFEYGQTTSLGNTTATSSTGAVSSNVAVLAPISGLESGTTYYYRLNGQNGYGTRIGNISVFTTQPTNPPVPPLGSAPTSMTIGATSVTSSSAVLNGEVNPNGSATTYHFEYGKSTLFGLFSLDQTTEDKGAGKGTLLTKFAVSIAGLDNDTTYYYQLVADNQYGTTDGGIYSFTTKKNPK